MGKDSTVAVMVDEQRRGHEVTREEGLDRAARKRPNMSGPDFVAAWDAGQFEGKADNAKVAGVAMLIPFAR